MISVGASTQPPHPLRDVLLFLAHSIGVASRSAHLRMSHPLLHHVQRHAVDGRIDPETMAQTFGTAVRRIGETRLDHDPLHDLSDPHAAEWPDRRSGPLARPLRLSQSMRGVHSVEILRWYRHRPIDDLRRTGGILALLETADRDGSAREAHTGRVISSSSDGRPPGIVQRFAKRAVPGGLAPGRGEESCAPIDVEVEPVSGGVVEAHFGYV